MREVLDLPFTTDHSAQCLHPLAPLVASLFMTELLSIFWTWQISTQFSLLYFQAKKKDKISFEPPKLLPFSTHPHPSKALYYSISPCPSVATESSSPWVLLFSRPYAHDPTHHLEIRWQFSALKILVQLDHVRMSPSKSKNSSKELKPTPRSCNEELG